MKKDRKDRIVYILTDTKGGNILGVYAKLPAGEGAKWILTGESVFTLYEDHGLTMKPAGLTARRVTFYRDQPVLRLGRR